MKKLILLLVVIFAVEFTPATSLYAQDGNSIYWTNQDPNPELNRKVDGHGREIAKLKKGQDSLKAGLAQLQLSQDSIKKALAETNKVVAEQGKSIKQLLDLHWDDTIKFSQLSNVIYMDIFPHLKNLDTMFRIHDTVINIHSECLAYLGQYTKKKTGSQAAFGKLTTSSQNLLKSYGSISSSNNNLNLNTGGNQNQRKPFTLIRTDYSAGGWIWRTAVVGWTIYTVGCLLKHPGGNVGTSLQQGWTDGPGGTPTH